MECSQLLQQVGVNHFEAWYCPTFHTGDLSLMSATVIFTGFCSGRLLWCALRSISHWALALWLTSFLQNSLFISSLLFLWYTCIAFHISLIKWNPFYLITFFHWSHSLRRSSAIFWSSSAQLMINVRVLLPNLRFLSHSQKPWSVSVLIQIQDLSGVRQQCQPIIDAECGLFYYDK